MPAVGAQVSHEERVAQAVEYAAYQLGIIARTLQEMKPVLETIRNKM